MKNLQKYFESYLRQGVTKFRNFRSCQHELIGIAATERAGDKFFDVRSYDRQSGATTILSSIALSLADSGQNVALVFCSPGVTNSWKTRTSDTLYENGFDNYQSKGGKFYFESGGSVTFGSLGSYFLRGKSFDTIIGDNLLYDNSFRLLTNFMAPHVPATKGRLILVDTF